MERDVLNSGEIYEPRTAANNFAVTADGNWATPVIIDLAAREVVWADLTGYCRDSSRNNSAISTLDGHFTGCLGER